ncbi:MAG: mannitol dehydrogenase family protein [Clostridiales bacterium]|jgi:fructuronate reductase|nr:mannitol dehydrogenase family protein [Clostridiales bacterium]
MLDLNLQSLNTTDAYEKIGIQTPSFDAVALQAETRKSPVWVHVGPGNIFRGYIAALAQNLIEIGDLKSGITAVSVFDHQILEKIYEPYDNLALQVIMHADGKLDKTVVASIGEALRAERGFDSQWNRLCEIFTNPGLQMVSFTITEKGYHLRGMDGNFYSWLNEDFESGAEKTPSNSLAIVASLLLKRYYAGAFPIAMASMDNFSHNGSKLFESISVFAKKWVENGSAPIGFYEYVSDPSRVSFPWSVIDKITPRPDPSVARELLASGFSSAEVYVTDKNTYIAPFVNAEAAQYLVIEDLFPNGRPPLEKAGVYFASRETVDLFERMKVCTCLNPLHTAMSIFGCLLGYASISAEMKDADIVSLISLIGYNEGLPVVANPGIVKPVDFLNEVMKTRLPNPYIPDTPQRISTDTSQKLAIRFGETIKLHRLSGNAGRLRAIPLAIAGWCRYLLGVDDEGKPMAISPDPLLDELQAHLEGVELGSPDSLGQNLKPILSSERIFGQNLYEAGLGEKIEAYAKKMLSGSGAVRKTLHEEVGKQ